MAKDCRAPKKARNREVEGEEEETDEKEDFVEGSE
jgi:hypothetical protein